MEILLFICLVAEPQTCREERLRVSMEPVPEWTCTINAPAIIARWGDEHFNWRVTRWRCGRPGKAETPI